MISSVIDGNECRGLDDGIFEGLHGFLMWCFPYKGGGFVGKVDEQAGNGRIIFDPDTHVTSNAKEGTDVRKVLTSWPVVDFVNLGVVRDAAFMVALVYENGDLRDGDKKLRCGDGSSGTEESVKNMVNITDMLPNKAADLWVSRDHLIPTILGFVAGSWSFDAGVIYKGYCGVGNLRLNDENDITMEYHQGISPTCWQGCQSHCTYMLRSKALKVQCAQVVYRK